MGIHAELNAAARGSGLEVIERGPGHFQILGGPLLVNYYPCSKRRTLYIDGMNGSFRHITPKRAIQIALDPGSTLGPGKKKDKRRQHRAQRFKKRRFDNAERAGNSTIPCRWCEHPLTRQEATVDHIVPLALGGLDNANNFCLACAPCNHDKANKMPGGNHE